MKKVILSTVGMLVLMLGLVVAATASGQSPCPQCGQIHAATGGQSVAAAAGTRSVVVLLNRQRAARGLPPYIFDPVLQRVAERRALLTAATGRFRGHPPGSFSPGRGEGVGMSSSLRPTAVHACLTYSTRYRYCGCAMVQRNGRSFFALIVR